MFQGLDQYPPRHQHQFPVVGLGVDHLGHGRDRLGLTTIVEVALAEPVLCQDVLVGLADTLIGVRSRPEKFRCAFLPDACAAFDLDVGDEFTVLAMVPLGQLHGALEMVDRQLWQAGVGQFELDLDKLLGVGTKRLGRQDLGVDQRPVGVPLTTRPGKRIALIERQDRHFRALSVQHFACEPQGFAGVPHRVAVPCLFDGGVVGPVGGVELLLRARLGGHGEGDQRGRQQYDSKMHQQDPPTTCIPTFDDGGQTLSTSRCCVHQQLDQRYEAAFIVAPGDPVGGILDLRRCIPHGHPEAGTADHRQVVRRVADRADRRLRHP